MRNNHGASGRLSSYVSRLRYARNSASCTTSSPSVIDPVMRAQYRCSCGRSWLMVSRNARYRASNLPASSTMCILTGINGQGVPSLRLRLVPLPLDLKHDVGAVPLGPVLHEVDVAAHDVPDDYFASHPFSASLTRSTTFAGGGQNLKRHRKLAAPP